MKLHRIAVSVFLIVAAFWLFFSISRQSYRDGWNAAKAEIPGCLYVDRPPAAARPWGCNYKEGVDVRADDILGGGLYVSLEPWKAAAR